jgi:hypothetical protein
MAETSKSLIRSEWAQFFAAQALALLIYSLGIAYWLGGFTSKMAELEKNQMAQVTSIESINKEGTIPGRLDQQLNVSQERRIQLLENNVQIVNTQLGVIVSQVTEINKKLDKEK